MTDRVSTQTTAPGLRVAPVSRLASDPRVEQAALALAWSELNEHGRQTCDWLRDFSEAERQEYRAKALIVMEAINA